MKKSYLIVFLIIFVSVVFAYFKVKEVQVQKNSIRKYNSEFELYNRDDLNGLDVVTLINKAININDKNDIEKDENDYYKLDDEFSVMIYIRMRADGDAYRFERINQLGINSFIAYFGEIGFKCTEIEYHKGGRVKSMTFEAKNY